MTKFEPLAKEMNSELVASMLDAARREFASDRAMTRTLTALGVGVGLTTVASALKAGSASTAGHAGMVQVLGGTSGAISSGATSGAISSGATSGAIASGGLVSATVVKSGLATKVAASLVSSGAAKWAAAMGAVALVGYGINDTWRTTAEPSVVPVAPSVSEPEPVREHERVVAVDVVTPAPAFEALQMAAPVSPPRRVKPATEKVVPLLAREVNLIDQARAALAAHKPAQTVQLAKAYQGEFPRGRLLPEALYLHMEGNLALGERSAAEQDARRLRSFGKHSAHEPRAREVLENE